MMDSTFPSSSTQSGPPESPWQVSSPPMMKPFSAAKSFSLLPLFSTLADLRDNCECELAGALHLTWTSVCQVSSFSYALEHQILKTGIWNMINKTIREFYIWPFLSPIILSTPEHAPLVVTGGVVYERDVDCVDEGSTKLLPYVDHKLLAEIVRGLKTNFLGELLLSTLLISVSLCSLSSQKSSERVVSLTILRSWVKMLSLMQEWWQKPQPYILISRLVMILLVYHRRSWSNGNFLWILWPPVFLSYIAKSILTLFGISLELLLN